MSSILASGRDESMLRREAGGRILKAEDDVLCVGTAHARNCERKSFAVCLNDWSNCPMPLGRRRSIDTPGTHPVGQVAKELSIDEDRSGTVKRLPAHQTPVQVLHSTFALARLHHVPSEFNVLAAVRAPIL
jgi:hypothetical protein